MQSDAAGVERRIRSGAAIYGAAAIRVAAAERQRADHELKGRSGGRPYGVPASPVRQAGPSHNEAGDGSLDHPEAGSTPDS